MGHIPPARYVVWQYSGYGAHTEKVFWHEIATFGRRKGALDAYALDVLRWLQDIAPASQTLSNRDGMIVFEMKEGALAPPN
jgi:hypothetical protein